MDKKTKLKLYGLAILFMIILAAILYAYMGESDYHISDLNPIVKAYMGVSAGIAVLIGVLLLITLIRFHVPTILALVLVVVVNFAANYGTIALADFFVPGISIAPSVGLSGALYMATRKFNIMVLGMMILTVSLLTKVKKEQKEAEEKGEKYEPFKDSDIEGKEEFEEIKESLKKK